jgi:hypothetical protein
MAGDRLSDIEVRALEIPPPAIEQTVGNYSFHLDGGKLITSNKAGREVNKLILERWKTRGLITRETYVESSQFTGNAEYNLTLSGRQEGDSNVILQFLSGLTLFILPYWVNTEFDLVYSIEHVGSGKKFEAKASESYLTITRTYNRLADHLYQQLAEQGAFSPETLASNPSKKAAEGLGQDSEAPSSAVERLRLLDELRSKGMVTDEEYEKKKGDILRDL